MSRSPAYSFDPFQLLWLAACGLFGFAAGATAQSSQPPVLAPARPAAQEAPHPPEAPHTPRFVIVLDAAHGGEDNGAQLAGGVPEKNVTLALSVRLRSLLSARGLPVVTTREGDLTVDSISRAGLANRAAASACLSLHASESGAGVHIYVSSLNPAAPTRFLAWKTAQSAFVTRSLKLASTVNSALEHSTAGDPSSNPGAPPPVILARTSLPVIDSMACPALAIEIAPLRNADHQITTDVGDTGYQTTIVDALAAALLEWKSDSDSGGGPSNGRLP